MAFFEDMFKGGNIVTGLAIGIGIAVLGPVLRPVLRPVAKSMLRAGISAYEQGRLAIAEMSEEASDMMAEARAELAHDGESPGDGQAGRERAQEARAQRRQQQHAGA